LEKRGIIADPDATLEIEAIAAIDT